MEDKILLYHGSSEIVRNPVFGKGRMNNDYGLGFYCTRDLELAKEWAVTSQDSGFANRYILDTRYLNILFLNDPKYTILNWIAILVEHRLFSLSSPNSRKAKAYLIEHFALNVNAYDLVIGYRADDSYFDYAEAFLNNGITVSQLAKAMELGELGEQVVLKSEFAFQELSFDGYEEAKRDIYYPMRKKRNDNANALYWKMLEEEADGLFIQDIIRGGITNDDGRIPRNKPQ